MRRLARVEAAAGDRRRYVNETRMPEPAVVLGALQVLRIEPDEARRTVLPDRVLMAFTDNAFRGAMLVALNGEDKGAPLVKCVKCSKPLLRVFTTAGARRVNPQLLPFQDVCINAKWIGPIPCPEAIKAKGLIDLLMEAARR